MDQVILDVQDDVSSWRPGERIVLASTDYSMYQAEEFTLLPCSHCSHTQLRIQGETPGVRVSGVRNTTVPPTVGLMCTEAELWSWRFQNVH